MLGGKSALLIDGQSLYHAAKALNFEVDFRLLMEEFERRTSILRAYYYTTVSEHDSTAIGPLLDWLDYNGFTVRTKPVRDYDDGEGRRRTKRSLGIEPSMQWTSRSTSKTPSSFRAMEIFAVLLRLCRGEEFL